MKMGNFQPILLGILSLIFTMPLRLNYQPVLHVRLKGCKATEVDILHPLFPTPQV
jgi:hypothetical protein